MKRTNKRGQAIILVTVALGIFALGALGLAVDLSQLYGHQQMAQVAADAAAQAEMMSLFQGVDSEMAGTSHTCTTSGTYATSDTNVACKYAWMNGFGRTSSDTVTVYYQTCSVSNCGTVPSALSNPANQVKVTVLRNVSNGFIRMVGGSPLTTVGASGVAAALAVVAPVPLLVIHPTLAGALSINGNTNITIRGGPTRSIQVNSSSTTAFVPTTGSTVDLSLGGPNYDSTTGQCTTGMNCGSNFGVFGGPAPQPPVFSFGTTPGQYVQPASPIQDPLCLSGDGSTNASTPCNVSPPVKANLAVAPAPITLTPGASADPVYGCPSSTTLGSNVQHCIVYSPGIYSSGISLSHDMGIFQPGIYWMDNGSGFGTSSFGGMMMCSGTGCTNDSVTQSGMLVYNSGGGLFSVTGSSNVSLSGTPDSSAYKGILFFQDRNSPATGNGASSQHTLGGGGGLQLQGTIYITNTRNTITSTGHYQQVNYHGGPCSSTFTMGMIIVDALTIKGGGCINMLLDPTAYLTALQVALIGGGPHS
jgi:hypothetical protein